jgi:hypothetical protein
VKVKVKVLGRLAKQPFAGDGVDRLDEAVA